MFDPKLFEDMAKKMTESLPSGFQSLKSDFEKNFKTLLQSTFNKMDLVTREEFDVQTEVLARTRKRLEVLEQQVAELEKNTQQK